MNYSTLGMNYIRNELGVGMLRMTRNPGSLYFWHLILGPPAGLVYVGLEFRSVLSYADHTPIRSLIYAYYTSIRSLIYAQEDRRTTSLAVSLAASSSLGLSLRIRGSMLG